MTYYKTLNNEPYYKTLYNYTKIYVPYNYYKIPYYDYKIPHYDYKIPYYDYKIPYYDYKIYDYPDVLYPNNKSTTNNKSNTQKKYASKSTQTNTDVSGLSDKPKIPIAKKRVSFKLDDLVKPNNSFEQTIFESKDPLIVELIDPDDIEKKKKEVEEYYFENYSDNDLDDNIVI